MRNYQDMVFSTAMRLVANQAEAEVTDESAIHSRLMDLQTRLELGELSEEEFLRQEDALMRRLNDIHKYKEQKALGNRH